MVDPVDIFSRRPYLTGEGPPTGGGDELETRVAALEKKFDKIEGKLDTLIRDVAEVKGRVGAMPSTWQMVGFVVALIVAIYTFSKLG